MALSHGYPFDPSYGYRLADLLRVTAPEPPKDFETFWRERLASTLEVAPRPRLRPAAQAHPNWLIHDLSYTSTGDFEIGGWLLVPRQGEVKRGVVMGHGYGGRDGPDLDLPVVDTAVLFPCFRGLSRSARPPISSDPHWHVLHGIDSRDAYIIGGCVDDLWLAVSTLLDFFPQVEGRVAYSGSSFGGGVGALAIPWDGRIRRGFLEVPTFGNHPLRVTFQTTGSGAAVQALWQRHRGVLDTLAFYDAATAARFISVPMLVAAAAFDPVVPPPGQFAIYNAIESCKRLFTLDAGHFDYPGRQVQDGALRGVVEAFFAAL